MRLSPKAKENLDNFGPIGCGLGSMSFPVIELIYVNKISETGIDTKWMALSVVLAYLLCTCTHRKYFVYSPAALLGSIGFPIGFFLGQLFSIAVAIILNNLFINYDMFNGGLFFCAIFSFIVSFMLSRYVCRKGETSLENEPHR